MSCYDCPSTNNGVVANGDALQDDNTRAYPNVAPDPNRAGNERLSRHEGIHLGSMIMIRNVAEWADKAVGSYLNAFRRIEDRETVDIGLATYDQSRYTGTQTGGQQNDVVIQSRHITDQDIPRISWNADTTDPALPANLHAQQTQASNTYTNANRAWTAYDPID
jgi:hypothetical protein